jgi:Rrf2 family protein
VIKLNRTTEYGLMALRHMSRKTDVLTSAREVADTFGLPFEITAKTLQRLKDSGLIQSSQGARGGYTLTRPLDDVTLAEFLAAMEGQQNVVPCSSEIVPADSSPACEYHSRCEISTVMRDLNARVLGFLGGIKLSELAIGAAPAPAPLAAPVITLSSVGGYK